MRPLHMELHIVLTAASEIQSFSVMWQTHSLSCEFLCKVTFPGDVQIKHVQKCCHTQGLRRLEGKITQFPDKKLGLADTKSILRMWHNLLGVDEGIMNIYICNTGLSLMVYSHSGAEGGGA